MIVPGALFRAEPRLPPSQNVGAGEVTGDRPRVGRPAGARRLSYRFENWNERRAPFRPYFFRSFIRLSRVR
jgi:hypothetical protein